MTDRDVTHTVETVPLARLPSGRTVETVLHRYLGDPDGPTVYLQALQHGGEVNGAAVLRRLHDRLTESALAGEVLAVPVANPFAFDHRVYMAPTRLDAINSNMNRLWPGDPDGTLMERLVDSLWQRAAGADAIVDLHTGGPYMRSHTRFTPDDSRSRDLARAFGLDLIVADGSPIENPDTGGQGKLREMAAAAGIPAITPELAHSREIVDASVDRGVAGIENVLVELGVIDGLLQTGEPTVGTEKTPLFTEESGLFRSNDLSVGDRIDAGTEIGEVFDPTSYESLQTIVADRAGMLLSLNRGSTVMEGESIGSLITIE
ncbi:succinylglutamate desuccinylase/aspartoacylase [Halodesulfurarchaeum formicicum]|uniref:Succinylglutamate desuccinylase/aspartoacylase n=1 Tax=Halodesulfurarchaeum formicicum TaxID=1873524 RepID=A0A1D8S6C0_9EURY|nr:succinylglutamate desuccinylase/aspartoacylase family protein [Halodesulfurarchaeum formicicum]AOW80912.1 succinylglutamate desuccinylase/aspartoacylase [Halodesulfurarchaeum formicicum]APE96245.1 succinylglutamate desuccinylase/aspartoacylase [Halodesulfurarchaeum formicicum]